MNLYGIISASIAVLAQIYMIYYFIKNRRHIEIENKLIISFVIMWVAVINMWVSKCF